MKIYVDRGQSRFLSFLLTPQTPVNGLAEDWKFTCVQENPGVHVSELDVIFSPKSSASERLTETLTLQIELDKSVQTSASLWHFTGPGLIYAANAGDYKRCIAATTSNDGSSLQLVFSCLDDAGETFKFSFLAMHTDLKSGTCQTYASADPTGGVGRRD